MHYHVYVYVSNSINIINAGCTSRLRRKSVCFSVTNFVVFHQGCLEPKRKAEQTLDNDYELAVAVADDADDDDDVYPYLSLLKSLQKQAKLLRQSQMVSDDDC